MNNSILHDADVLGIEYQDKLNILILKLRLSNNEHQEMYFSEVYDFNLESFCNQNILFDIVQYGQNSKALDDALLMFPGLTSKVIEFAKKNNLTVYILEPSSGLRGYIVAPLYSIRNVI